MKATIEIPGDLYRRVKAKSALEGRPVRAVTEELYRQWLGEISPAGNPGADRDPDANGPEWFGALRRFAREQPFHDLDAVRDSIVRGIAAARREAEDSS